MEVWLIQDGEKTGPFHDYVIRRKIGTEELDASSPAWHEGLPEWTSLGEMPLFKGEFHRAEPAPAEEPLPPSATPKGPASPPVIPGNPRLARRFWARWLDIVIYTAVWWFLMWLTGRNIESLYTSLPVEFTRLIPWFVIEALLIHHFATTPGKWLLGLRVINLDGSRLTLAQSTHRSLRVLFIGIGFALPLVSLFCMGLSAYTTRRVGAPVWDHLGGHGISVTPFVPWRVVAVVALFFAAFFLQMGVLSPVVMKFTLKSMDREDQKPLREFIEKNPPFWSLPRRDQ